MQKMLLLIVFILNSTVFAQQSVNKEQSDQIQSTVFDEFGKISQKELKLRTRKLRKKLEEPTSKYGGLRAYLVFYQGSNPKTLSKDINLIKSVLYDDCLDCYGLSGGSIIFIDGGKAEKQKIQFWLSPRGAEPPTP